LITTIVDQRAKDNR